MSLKTGSVACSYGMGYSMVDVPDPANITAADVSAAVDRGKFYASTGLAVQVEQVERSAVDGLTVVRTETGEPVAFGVVGGAGSRDPTAPALRAFNVTLCLAKGENLTVTNLGCKPATLDGAAYVAPPLAHTLRLDLSALPLAATETFFFTRVQAVARSRYSLRSVDKSNKTVWQFELGEDVVPADVVEGRLVRLTGRNNRPFVVAPSLAAAARQHPQEDASRPDDGSSRLKRLVRVVRHFSHSDDEISPGGISLDGVEPGKDFLVSERWAWLQPVFRVRAPAAREEEDGEGADAVDGWTYEDPFASLQ